MVKMNKMATRLTIDVDLFNWLKAEADRRRTSASAIVRELILAEIERKKAQEAK